MYQNNGKATDLGKEWNAFAELTGKQLGMKNQPKTVDEYKAQFFNLLEAKVQMYIDHTELDKKPLSAQVIAFETQKQKDNKNGNLQSELFDKEKQVQAKDAQLASIPCSRSTVIWHYCILGIILLLAFSESFVVYQALRFMHIPTFGAIIFALGLGLGITVATEYLAQYIKRAATTKIAFMRGVIITLLMYLLFLTIASIRISGMEQQQSIDSKMNGTQLSSQKLTPFWLAGLSTGLFVIGLLISIRHGLSKEERALMGEYVKTKKDRADLRKTIKGLHKQMDAEDKNAMAVSTQAVKVLEDATITESVLVRMAETAQAIFATTNMNFRQDGYCPEFFSTPPKFQLTFFRNKINKQHHESIQP
jgi:hypothetical protein